jgi:hypothetical protein
LSGRIGRALRLVVLGLLAATASAATPATCARYADTPIQTGRTPLATPELSGFVASLRHPNIYWAHEDSGHAAVLYAMRETGTIVGTFPLPNVDAADPEDIALGPCGRADARACLYLADTGDNVRGRRHVRIFRIREPESLRGAPLAAEKIPFTYPDGAHDAEAVLVDPRTAELYVVTKTITSLGDVYHLEHPPGGAWSAVRVASLAVADGFDALTTGASVHPGGERVLLRTYRGVWEFRRPGARDLLDVLRTPAEPRPAPNQPQGEAVSYTADGTGYLLGSEGAGSPIFRIDCRTR